VHQVAALRLFTVTIAVVIILVASFSGAIAQTGPDLGIVSERYIVIDGRTGEIYAERGMHDPVAPASLTKIFTAIEAIEAAPDSYQIVTTNSDLVDWDATRVGFSPGELFTLEDLLYGMMLPSGNDAALAVARALGAQEGDSAEQAVSRFMERTNQRIRAMGLSDTVLVNPDGWGVPGHVSSAYDVAAFTMYALKYPRFIRSISAESYTTSNGRYDLVNSNKRLGAQRDLLGGKTGYDDTAGYCLMQVARRGDDIMIAVTLDGVAPDVWYDDNRSLLDFGFAQAELRRETGSGVTGQIARYLDPDAAVIQQLAQSDATVGAAAFVAAPPEGVQAASDVALDATPSFAEAQASGRSMAGLALAVALASVVIAIRTVSSWLGYRPPAAVN
jgi:serine-type D-Ala-D-Ala carboxypeptidase (penicillin-binding protein 5/6)